MVYSECVEKNTGGTTYEYYKRQLRLEAEMQQKVCKK